MKAKNKPLSKSPIAPPSDGVSALPRHRWSDGIIWVMVCFLFLFHLSRTFECNVDYDDWEHLASSWFIFNGYEPYRDFFQHHNPLWWYMLAPFFWFLSEPYYIFYLARIITAGFVIGSIVLIAKIIRYLKFDSRVSLYALFIYLAYPITYLGYFIHQRPDTPMLFFLLLGFYQWIRFVTEKRNRLLVGCYFSFFLSFMFLQKALIFLAPFGVYQLWLLFRKELKWGAFLRAIILPLILSVGYIGYLIYQGCFIRYWETNYILNAHVFRDYAAYKMTILDSVLHIIGAFFLVIALVRTNGWRRQLLCVLAGGLLLMLALPKPYTYYYFPWVIVAAVIIGIGIRNWSPFVRGLFFFPIFSFDVLAFCLMENSGFYHLPNVQELREEIGQRDEFVTYGDAFTALIKQSPEHYYWHFLSSVAWWDSHLFNYAEYPMWSEKVTREMPKYIAPHRVYDIRFAYTPDKVLMKSDAHFLRAHYNRLPTELHVWKRKD